MANLEGKLSIWIKGGKFTHSSDLYVKVFIDDNDIWKTDEKDGSSPDWDSTCVKHIKGNYEKIVLKLLDEDTFSRDDVIATSEFTIADLLDNGVNESVMMRDEDGKEVGNLDVSINFEAGDVNMFQLLSSKLHKDD